MATTITIAAPSPSAANRLAEALANPMNAWDVANAGNNTVEVNNQRYRSRFLFSELK
jgi:hypothetical protein